MRLYNSIIEQVCAHCGAGEPKAYPYEPERAWPETEDFELVLQRDAAFELGGDGKPSVGLTCVTTDPRLVPRDEILVYGRELSELKGSTSFARIALIQVCDIESDDVLDTEQAFRAVQNIDFVKYHVYPQGYMMRASAQTHKEQVRVSREAVRRGISFRSVGNAFIHRYKQDINVLAVKLIFVTAEDANFAALQADAKASRDITMTLSKILEGMPTDCGACSLKPICDEVEGMKELHFGKESHTTE